MSKSTRRARDTEAVHTPWRRIWGVTTIKGFSAVGAQGLYFSEVKRGKKTTREKKTREITPFIYARDTNKAYKQNSTVTPFALLTRQRKRPRSRDDREHPMRLDRTLVAPSHFMLLLYTSAVLHGLEPPRETIRLNHSRGDRNLGDEDDRIKRHTCATQRPGVL